MVASYTGEKWLPKWDKRTVLNGYKFRDVIRIVMRIRFRISSSMHTHAKQKKIISLNSSEKKECLKYRYFKVMNLRPYLLSKFILAFL